MPKFFHSRDLEFIKTIETDQYFQELDQHASNARGIERVRVNNKTMVLSEIDLTNCSYLELVNETYFDSVSGLFITEKTFRTIALGHIFLICGQQGLLAHLKQEGFQTFDDLFDESYDDESDLQKKISLILDNVSNYEKCPYDNETLKRIEHNHSLFYNQQRIYDGLKTELIDPIKNFIGTQ